MREYNFNQVRKRFRKAQKRAKIMARRRQQRRRQQNRNRISGVGILKIVVAVVLVVFLLTRASAFFKKNVIEINLTAQNAEMYVGEEKPVFEAKVSCEGDTQTILDEDTGYTIQNLIDELEGDTGYTLESSGDGSEVGTFDIIPELTSAVSTPLDTDWSDKVKINVVKGVLTVKEIDEEYLAKVEARKNRPMIALTFDDGPSKYTMKLLEALEENDAQATFFMLGQNVPNYEETVKKMYEIGCELGNHSLSHPNLVKQSTDEIQRQINETNAAIENAAGHPASLVRPPFGSVNAQVKEAIPFPLIMWSVDTEDWKTRDKQATIDHVLANVKDGDIVLMHDIYETSVDAAIELIGQLKEQGYYLVTISELAESRGYTMTNGEKYFEFPNND